MNLTWLHPSALQVWSVEPGAAQLCWGHLPRGEVRIEVSGREPLTFIHEGGAGAVVVDRLSPGPVEFDVRSIVGTQRLDALLPKPPPGEELCRIATVSDLHLGSRNWGALKTVKDIEPDGPDRYAMRCAKSALQEASDWGAQLLVIKGDAAHHRRTRDFGLVGDLVDHFPKLPMILVPGNHDVDNASDIELPTTIGRRGLPLERGVRVHDMDGVRVIAGNTSIEHVSIGTVNPIAEDVFAAASKSDTPNLLLIHHQFQKYRVPTYWPPGIPVTESKPFLKRLGAVAPRTLVSSGHTHRNRTRRVGPLLVTEVCSTKDWPGCWAGYRIYEGGIYQSAYRTATPTAIRWTEYSRRALFGLWSPWSPGSIDDRCAALLTRA